jgi:hypothetical protein
MVEADASTSLRLMQDEEVDEEVPAQRQTSERRGWWESRGRWPVLSSKRRNFGWVGDERVSWRWWVGGGERVKEGTPQQ